MIPSTDRVHDQADDSAVHPSSNNRVSAAGTRLRRRLSISFHCDSCESGFACRQGLTPLSLPAPWPGTRRSNQPASCQSPRIQR
ncbi:MAG: hypothetical protein AW09_003509 [Candidatus Accumulibacter phosphatis]|uniref:Uncharacterized protein n=1 Tax=Candidatus Accumulibacter phosphatis TaxID=327160 RepID=A0A080LSI0_9PROT|nr:MAG: hypothetical protein AW09_003509 [Candidatus Accumulibacter phosphatis]